MIAHALEGLAAKGCGAFSDGLGVRAFCLALENLPRSFRGDLTAREKMHEASTMAGLCFTHAGLGLCHALSHALGGALHLPHGRLNAILLPAVVAYNAKVCGEKYAYVAAAAGIPGSVETLAVRNLKNTLVRLRRELGLPKDLKEAGADMDLLERSREDIIKAACADPCAGQNPLGADPVLVGRILDEVTDGG